MQDAAPPARPPRRSGMEVLGLVLFAGVLAVLGWRYIFAPPSGSGRDGAEHPAVGRKLTTLRLEPLTGKASSLTPASLSGKVTLVNFWGPWCPPCRAEFPHLYELRQSFLKEPRAHLVSVSCSGHEGPEDNSPEDRQATEEFLREQRADMPTYYDPFFKTRRHLLETAKLDQFAYPTTVILDGQGAIRGLWQGYLPGDELKMHRLMEKLLRETAEN